MAEAYPDSGPLVLFTHLARTALFLDALQHECLEPHGLRFSEYSVLRVLRYAGPSSELTPTRLADLTLITTGGMTKIVDRLERSGLVGRRADPDDRRGVLVSLTDSGRALADAASDDYAAGRQRIVDRLGAEEAAAIDDALGRLLTVFEADQEATT